MPDTEIVEQGTAAPEDAAPDQTAGVEDTTPPDTETEEPTGDPRSIPYVRFKEVNDRAKSAEEQVRAANERIARLEAQQQQPPAQQPITIETVFDAYERGQITETQKDQWVIHLAKESAKQEFGQVIGQTALLMRSQSVVESYAKEIPAVNDTSSPEFQELKQTYQELLNEGAPNTVATQAKALRMTFGPIKPKRTNAGEHTRQRADTFLEGAGGGAGLGTDPLKDVPDAQRQYWKTKGYTKDQMLSEAAMLGVKNVNDFARLSKRGTR